MKLDFTGKTVVVTGGTAGIGLAAARMFCANGANVVVCGRDEAKLASALLTLKQSGSAAGFPCDVTRRAQVLALADKAAETFGGMDVWVNNAGHTGSSDLMDVTEAFCGHEFSLNFNSILWGSQAAFKYMREKGGVIINASSYSSVMPMVGVGLYGASKSAVTSVTRTLAAELAPYHIRVAGYMPGPVLTPMLEESLGKREASVEDDLARIAATVALHRVGQPEEVANLILFLASEEAGFISGACVEISGGKFTAQNIARAWK
jgi:NAD(P)-dependent dehydrogenase (short-subunit alcohol dehydrogenase family)